MGCAGARGRCVMGGGLELGFWKPARKTRKMMRVRRMWSTWLLVFSLCSVCASPLSSKSGMIRPPGYVSAVRLCLPDRLTLGSLPRDVHGGAGHI